MFFSMLWFACACYFFLNFAYIDKDFYGRADIKFLLVCFVSLTVLVWDDFVVSFCHFFKCIEIYIRFLHIVERCECHLTQLLMLYLYSFPCWCLEITIPVGWVLNTNN